MWLRSRPGSDCRRFKGLIDDVRIYNYALSKAEIEALCSGRGPAIAGHTMRQTAGAAVGEE
ncbi:MAG: hypothetical protein JSW47_12110 [Phycisphaerales bacterium]|nr:MAG: hypothetical protein JSW47_12110 [Phycisphaerales bacterium]